MSIKPIIKSNNKIKPILSNNEAKSTKVQLKTDDGKVFEMSASAYSAIRGDYLDEYSAVDEAEKSVLAEYKKYIKEAEQAAQKEAELAAQKEKASKSAPERTQDFVVPDYTPSAFSMTKAEYNRRRQSNPSLPEFGSYDYFKQREESLRPIMDEIANDADRQQEGTRQMADNYANGTTKGTKAYDWSKELYDKFKYQDAIIAEYKALDEQLKKYESNGVHYDENGNVDTKSGKEEAKSAKVRYDLLSRAGVLTDEEMRSGYLNELPEEKQKQYDQNVAISKLKFVEASKENAYDDYEKDKDKVYSNDLGGRFAGNAKVGRIGIKTNNAGYASMDASTSDLEAVEVYQLLSNRIQQNNATTFQNNTKGQQLLATISQYVPQAVDQLTYEAIGRAVGLASGTYGLGNFVGSAGSAGYMYRQTAGASFVRMLQESDLSVEDAKKLAQSEALSSSAVEFGLEYAAGALFKTGTIATKGAISEVGESAIKRATSGLMAKGISEKGAKTIIKAATTVGKLALNGAGEGVEEWIQEGMSITADRYAKAGKTASPFELFLSSFDLSQYSKDDFKRMGDSFVAGMIIGFGHGGVRATASAITNKTMSNIANSIDETRLGKKIIDSGNMPIVVSAIETIRETASKTEAKSIDRIETAIKDGKQPSARDVGIVVKSAFSETNLTTESVSVGDKFTDTKTGKTIEVVERNDTATVVKITSGTKTITKKMGNLLADDLIINERYQQITDETTTTEENSPVENVVVSEMETVTENPTVETVEPSTESEVVTNVRNAITSAKLTSKQIDGIISNQSSRDAFETITGVKLAGTKAEQRAIVRNWHNNAKNAPVSNVQAPINEVAPSTEKTATESDIAPVVNAMNETLKEGALEEIYASMPSYLEKSLDIYANVLRDFYRDKGSIGHIADYFTDGGAKVISAIENLGTETVVQTAQKKDSILPKQPESATIESKTTTTSVSNTDKSHTVAYTNDNQKIDAKFKVVSVDDLIASNDIDGRVNPNYPQDLQPRDRERASSMSQITQMAANLNPARLAESTSVAEGAPIVGPDNVVESGNGRTLGIKMAYDKGYADAYKNFIISNADKYGIDVSNLPDRPVLVRERLTEVDRLGFTRKANESSISSLSATEQAKVDAEKLTDKVLSLLVANDDGEINTPANKDFIKVVIANVFKSEDLNNVVNADGTMLSQRGKERITNAIFYKAYGDASLSARMSESLDNDMKNATRVLLNIAPKVVDVKNRIALGTLYNFDFSGDIASAIRLLEKCRNNNQTVTEYASQESLFEKEPLIVMEMAYVFETLNRGAKQATMFYNTLLDEVVNMGNPDQIRLDVAEVYQTKEEIVDATIRNYNNSEESTKEITIPESIVRSESESRRDDDGRGNDESAWNNTAEKEEVGHANRVQHDGGRSEERGIVENDEQLRQTTESTDGKPEIREENSNEERRNDLLPDNGRRGDTGSTRKQARQIQGFERKNQGKNAIERRKFGRELVKRGQVEKVNDGTHEYTLVKPEAYNDEMKSMVEEAARNGRELSFFIGNAIVTKENGDTFEADGIRFGGTNRVAVRYDGSKIPQKLAKHEIIHSKWFTPKVQKIAKKIIDSLTDADKQKISQQKRYQYYETIYEDEVSNGEENIVWEEFVCDVMSGMNDYTVNYIDDVNTFWYGNEDVESYDPATYATSTDAGGNKYSVSSAESDIDVAINQSMTMEQAKDMIQRAFVLGGIKEWFDGEYKNGDEWLKGEGADAVALVVENEWQLQQKFLDKIESGYNEDFFAADIIEAYANGTLTGKVKQNVVKRLDTSKSTKAKDTRVFSPKEIKNAQEIYKVASERVTNSNRAKVYQARADIIMFAHNRGAAEALGLTQSELNKKLSTWAGYSARAKEASMKLNKDVALFNKWTGIENSNLLNRATVSQEELDNLVNEVTGDSNGWQRNYIMRTMLALDTHIDYSELNFEFVGTPKTNYGKSVNGLYDNSKRKITAKHNAPHTVAHEMGHFLDYQWARDFGITHSALTEGFGRDKQTDADVKQFLTNFDEFIEKIENSADLRSEYTMDRKEVFARFVSKFVQWVDIVANGKRSYPQEYLSYNDKFATAHFVEFVRLLQEKSMIDSKKFESNKTNGNRYSVAEEGDETNGYEQNNNGEKLGQLEDSSKTERLNRVGEMGYSQSQKPNTPKTKRIHRSGVSAEVVTSSELTAEQASLKEQNKLENMSTAFYVKATEKGVEQSDLFVTENTIYYPDNAFERNDIFVKDGVASFTENRFNEMVEYYSVPDGGKNSNDYAKAYVAYISPSDFLSLTTTNESAIIEESKTYGKFNLKELQSNDIKEAPYLEIDFDYGEVIDHNGRHRMVMLRDAGVEKVAIVIRDPNSERNKSKTQKKTNVLVTGQYFDNVGTTAPGEVTIDEIIPLSPRYRNEVRKKFVDNKSDFRYSVAEESYAPTFYSQMGKVIDEMKMDKIAAKDVVRYLTDTKRGVKAEEIKWSGIEEFLEGKKSVTKAELQEFVAGSQLEIEETVLDNRKLPYSKEQAEQIAEYETQSNEVFSELQREWKKAIGTNLPMDRLGGDVESRVVRLLMEADRQIKESTDVGKEMVSADKELKTVFSKDDFGYDFASEAYHDAVRNPYDFIYNFDLTEEQKTIFERFASAKENYKNAVGIPLETQRHLKDIAAKADKIGRKLRDIEAERSTDEEKHSTKWDEYKLDGGKNYREITFKMPESTYSNQMMQVHWGTTGILAHARVQDFEVDGKKMLFIEEIQSDWHNQGHKEGYRQKGQKTELDIRLEDDDAYEEFWNSDVIKQLVDKMKEAGYENSPTIVSNLWDGNTSSTYDFLERIGVSLTNDEKAYIEEEVYKSKERHKELSSAASNNSAPDAPFKDNYHEYVLKRLIRMAAEEGYDSIGWTPSDVQMERWNPDRETNAELGIVDAKNPDAIAFEEGYIIEYDRNIKKFMSKQGDKWGAKVEVAKVNSKEREEFYFEQNGKRYDTHVGALNGVVEDANEFFKESGDDYVVSIIDTETKKVGDNTIVFDRMGTELGTITKVITGTYEEGGTEVWSMPITDSMKNSVLYEGQTRYSLATDGIPDLEDLWEFAKSKYGTIKKGETPARDIDVPKKINEKDVVSLGARTMMEAGVTPDWAVSEFEQAILDGTMTHEVITNKRAGAWAKKQIEHLGFKEALNSWNVYTRDGKVGKKELALGMELYNQCITNKDVHNAMKIAAELVAEATNAGQTLQAVRMLKRMTPDGQLYYIEKSIKKMNEEFQDKLGERFKDIELDEGLMEEFLTETDKEKRDEIYDKICQNIADQMPSTFKDKWNAWRYLAMLGNPRTHIRNIVGNAIFIPSIRLKNYVGAVIEKASRVDVAERTKSLHKSKEAVAFAKQDIADTDVMRELKGVNAKYATTDDIESKRTIFDKRWQAWIEKLRTKNFDWLEKEDGWFLKHHYVDALARLITARKIDVNSIDVKTLETLRKYAIKEAQAATYRDANALADGLNAVQRRIERSDKKLARASSSLIEGVMPFKKTPMNIAKQGIYYSPVGILKGIYTATTKLKNGDATVTDVIDDISKGLSGTMLLMIGYFLSSLGLLVGAEDKEKKEKEFDNMTGEQSYALKVFGKSYTIDWATPSNLALFVGSKLYDLTKDDFSFADVTSALLTVTEPLLELSVFSGLSGVIESAKYSDTNPIISITSDAITSYLMQALPTIGGQVSRIVDGSKREYYYADKTSDVPKGLQRLIGQASSKIPFASYLFETSVDEWGREESYGNIVERAFENTVSPGYYSAENYTRVDKELRKLYEKTGDSAVLPVIQQKYYTEDYVKYDMTAEEWTKVKKLRGKKSFELVRELISSNKYSAMTDKEKIKAIKKCYTEAGDYAKEQMLDKVKRKN